MDVLVIVGDIVTLYDPDTSISQLTINVDPEYIEIVSPDPPDPVITDILDPECPPAVGVDIVGVVVAKSAIAENTPTASTVVITEERKVKLYIQIKIKNIRSIVL